METLDYEKPATRRQARLAQFPSILAFAAALVDLCMFVFANLLQEYWRRKNAGKDIIFIAPGDMQFISISICAIAIWCLALVLTIAAFLQGRQQLNRYSIAAVFLLLASLALAVRIK